MNASSLPLSVQEGLYQAPSLVPEHTAKWLVKALAFATLALLLHALLLIHIPLRELDNGAKQEGSSGITVGIKRLTMPPAPAAVPPPELAKPPENKPVKSQAQTSDKPHRVVAPKPKPPAVAKPKLVNKQLPPKPKPKVQPKPELAKPESQLPAEPRLAEEVAKENTIPPVPERQSGNVAPIVGGGNPKVNIKYVRKLAAWLERHKRYPTAARRRNQQGTVLLSFTMNQRGQVQGYDLLERSEHALLNEAVERMIKKASPLPKVPKELMAGKENITFTVPVSFQLGRR